MTCLDFDPDDTGHITPRHQLELMLDARWMTTQYMAEQVGLGVSDAYIHLTVLFIEGKADMHGASDDGSEDVPTLEEQEGQLWRRL